MAQVVTGFAELAARSHYSFLEGASSPRELVATAADLGLGSMALCDTNGLYGAVSFVQAAAAAGIHPVVGTELDLVDGTRLRLLARDREGYHQLCRTISAAQLAGTKGQPRLDLGLEPVTLSRPMHSRSAAHASGAGGRPRSSGRQTRPVLAPPSRPRALRPTAGPFPEGWPSLPSGKTRATEAPARVDPAALSGCTVLMGGPDSAITRALIGGDRRGATRLASRLREAFGRDRVALLITHHLHPADTWLAAETAALAARCGLPLVASNTPVHATRGQKPLLDVLTTIRHRTTLDRAAAHGLLIPNAEHRLKSEAELRTLLAAHPEAFDHAAHIAEQCRLSLDFSDVRFPGFPVPDGETPLSVLRRLCRQALPTRYRETTPEVTRRLQRELDVIESTKLAEFFLITWDLMRFARENGIPGQGRGSAADSIVAYLLGITRVDPIAHDLLFERFLHEDHQGTPDIDIDFSTEHREQVIQYVYERYGAARTGMVANVVTFRPRMAVRQVGAALAFPEHLVDRLAKTVDAWWWGGIDQALETCGLLEVVRSERERAEATADGDASLPWDLFLSLCAQVEGCPRHLGIHVGGMLVTGRPLVDIVPVERAAMPGRVVVQFNKDDVEDLGLIKMDLLGLRTLGVIAECIEHVRRQTGERPDLDALSLDDPAVYDQICEPDTIGLFQIESRAQQQSLYQSQPREFNDLIVQVAIIRPGPIQGNAVNPYLRRRMGLEPVTYLHPSLEPILSDTRGVVLYQEQILRIVMEVAGYSAGQADRFRRAMNRHRTHEEMGRLHDEFVQRCGQHSSVPEAIAEELFRSVAGFALYGFCKSHAAAFARTAYETAWLRRHHAAAYLCSLLNAQPMGFYHPSVLVEDGKRHGVACLPVDVSRSRARCTLEWIGPGVPPDTAVGHGLCPGWTLDQAGVSTPDLATERSRLPGELAAIRAARGGGGAGPERAVSPWAVRLGFSYVRGLGPAGRAACDEAVLAGAATSVDAFWRHTLLPRRAMENLVLLGAFDAVDPGRPRRALLWELRATEDALPSRRRRATATTAMSGDAARLNAAELAGTPSDHVAQPPTAPSARPPAGPPRGRGAVAGGVPGDGPRAPRAIDRDRLPPLITVPAPAPLLPGMSVRDRTAIEYRLSELSTGPHLVAFLRDNLTTLGCVPIADVHRRTDGECLRVGGLVIARQAPGSAKGFRFFTLADEGGHIDLVFRPDVALRTRSVANFHPLLVVDGKLQLENRRINLVVTAVRAIDGTGRLLDPTVAGLGRGADPDVPRPQHGFTRPIATSDDSGGDRGWSPPEAHDFH